MQLAVYSTMFGAPWGGSEELWSGAVHHLLRRGHQAAVSVNRRCRAAPQLAALCDAGAAVELRRHASVGRSLRRIMQRLDVGQHPARGWLETHQPDLVLISIGLHGDDLSLARTCQWLGVPYALLLQAASPHHQFDADECDAQHAAYAGAWRRYFVSDENRRTVESSFALDLSDSRVVDNPFNVQVGAPLPWPASGERWRLACVARLHTQAKGQDALLQTLRQDKWRRRPLEVVFWGQDGGSRQRLEQLIHLFGLAGQVRFGGFADSIEAVWRDHHALVLPSRYEGNPLAMIEAMLCGRPPIVTNVGRAAELIDDNRTGFVAAAATVEALDDALERAWRRRHEWPAIGAAAAQTIRQRHSLTPAEDFAAELLAAAEEVHAHGQSHAA